MAQKRMFDKTITNSDEFIDMPDSSQNLYFHLSMNADDDGFVNNWKNIMRMTGHKDDDMKVLIAKKYIIPFESGVIVIRHWRINNYIRGDRYVETKYKDEKLQLQVDENLVYQMATDGIPGGIPSIEENRIEKNSIEKNSIDNGVSKSTPKKVFVPPTLEEVESYVKEKHLNVNAKDFLDYFEATNWVDSKGNKVKSWKGKILTWSNYRVAPVLKTKQEIQKEQQNDMWTKWLEGRKGIDGS